MERLIIGCGYLGLRVAKLWRAQGDRVLALSRDPEKLAQRAALAAISGLEIIEGDITQPASLPKFPSCDTVLLAVGMDRTRYNDIRTVYVEGLKHVLHKLSEPTRSLIYISSTGVYGQSNETQTEGWIDESMEPQPDQPGGKACLEAESVLRSGPWCNRSTILRFAGIYGPDRVPLSQAVRERRWEALHPAGHLNLIHVEDGAKIVVLLNQHRLSDSRVNESLDNPVLADPTLLVSDGNPVARRDFYEAMARQLGTAPIDWTQHLLAAVESGRSDSQPRRKFSHKRISNQRLIRTLNYQFRYPNAIDALPALLNDSHKNMQTE